MVWSGIPSTSPGKPCDLCKSEKDVENVMVKVNEEGCVKSVFPYVQSNLCKKCKEAGWFVQSRSWGYRLTYSNRNTLESKWV